MAVSAYDLSGQLDWQYELYKELHRTPEISMEEYKTSERIAEELTKLGVEPVKVGKTGLVGIVKNGEGKVYLARADFDGLPVKEGTGLPYASENEGIMHACGHDMHVTGLLGATRWLLDNKDAWAGTFIALFQPGEETAAGARDMVAGGLKDKIPAPDFCYAQHIMPTPAGKVYISEGAKLSAGDSVKVTIHGQGAHGSMPNLSIDPVVIAASIVVRLQSVVARVVAPSEFSVVTVGAVHTGTKSNIIPDKAEILLNMRHYNDEVRKDVIEAVTRIIKAECEAGGCRQEPDIEFYDQFPLTNNKKEAVDQLVPKFQEVFGDDFLPEPPAPASEDFSIIPAQFGADYVYAFIGSMDPEVVKKAAETGDRSLVPANHSPFFAPVIEPTTTTATSAHITAALAILGK
ncbi:amidohydrolase [Actinotignum urinale]|uniref:Amidohydrolase n=1 Tax=Actinotignum urinale TaxID=190146 RepID=A0AAW9HT09_9ACTO|nr:amidohydrolase [Actinotignum urinale]MDY5154783.1 amidohydrolase [Actinotignum urinale]